jgi:cytochrome c553
MTMRICQTFVAGLLCLAPLSLLATDMTERIKACEACHGRQGQAGPDGYYPRLAGKPAGYLYNQMQNFSQGRRQYTMMRRMMAPLSPQYQREMAEHFANLKVPYPAPSLAALASTEQMARGKQLALQGDPSLNLPACSSCHGQNLMGTPPHVPGLLGLPSAYLGAQLSAWTLGNRSTVAPDCMNEIAKTLSTRDAAAVTTWLASQSIPTHTTPHPAAPPPLNLRCGSAPELHGALK